jgi:hypothetical protein
MNKKMLTIEDAKIIFRNFEGREDKFNRAGNRNFAVLIEDKETALNLINDDWNLKVLKPRTPDDSIVYYLPVSVNMEGNVSIKLVTNKNVNSLDAESVSTLDYIEIESADLIIRPYDWEVNGKTGRKAYLKTAYITMMEDEFADKYER